MRPLWRWNLRQIRGGGLAKGDNEDWRDDNLEFIKDNENISEEGENYRDNANDKETLTYIVDFRNLNWLFLYLDTCPIWDLY